MTIPTHAAALAASQGGYVSRQQLMNLGMASSVISRRVANGEFIPVAHGVYRLFESREIDAVLHGAVLTLPDPVVSHESAARLHAIRSVRVHRYVVSVDASTTYRFPGVIVHRNRDLGPGHRSQLGGLPVTSLTRTVFDLAGVLPAHRMVEVVDELIGERRLTLGELEEVVRQLGRRGKPGTAIMRTILEDRGTDPAATTSKLERLGLEVLEAAGLPRPRVEFSPTWADTLTFDAAYPELRLAIEWDSRRWHAATHRFEHDRRRDRLAVLNGWVVLRFTWQDVTQRPGQVGREVAAAIELRNRHLAS